MSTKVNPLELQTQVVGVMKRLTPIEKERSKLISEYRKLYFKIFDNCDHFIVPSYYTYDRCEGRPYESYGCIKCGLNLMAKSSDGPYYDFEYEVMEQYFDSGKRLKGYKPKVVFKFNGYSTYGNFLIANRMCWNILKKNPFISNEELDQKLIEEVKKAKNKNDGKSRKRVSNGK